MGKCAGTRRVRAGVVPLDQRSPGRRLLWRLIPRRSAPTAEGTAQGRTAADWTPCVSVGCVPSLGRPPTPFRARLSRFQSLRPELCLFKRSAVCPAPRGSDWLLSLRSTSFWHSPIPIGRCGLGAGLRVASRDGGCFAVLAERKGRACLPCRRCREGPHRVRPDHISLPARRVCGNRPPAPLARRSPTRPQRRRPSPAALRGPCPAADGRPGPQVRRGPLSCSSRWSLSWGLRPACPLLSPGATVPPRGRLGAQRTEVLSPWGGRACGLCARVCAGCAERRFCEWPESHLRAASGSAGPERTGVHWTGGMISPRPAVGTGLGGLSEGLGRTPLDIHLSAHICCSTGLGLEQARAGHKHVTHKHINTQRGPLQTKGWARRTFLRRWATW